VQNSFPYACDPVTPQDLSVKSSCITGKQRTSNHFPNRRITKELKVNRKKKDSRNAGQAGRENEVIFQQWGKIHSSPCSKQHVC
jgi:hypothetical protein